MKPFGKKILLFQLTTILTINLSAQNSNNNVDLMVNKNFELFYAMHLASNVDSMLIANKYSGFPLTTQLDFELKRTYYKEYSRYKDYQQVRFYNEIASQGFIFQAPFNTLLRVDTNFNIIDSCYFEQLPLPQKAKESIVTFVDKLKEFSVLSNFNDFYNQNKPLYDQIILTHEKRIPLKELIFSIEDFFGWGLNGYHVILVPMMWPGGISLDYRENCIDSLQEIYVCIGTKSVKSDNPFFGSDEEYKSVIVHEFVHPFVMHYCIKYREQIEQYNQFFNKDEKIYRNNGCPDWFSAINELLTRTVEILINSNDDYEKAIKAIEYQSKDLGFSLIPILYQAIDEHYNTKKRKEINLDTVFLDIIHSLRKSG